MQVAFYISGHGFGHASRDIELVLALKARRPAARVVIRSAVAERVFAPLAALDGVDVQPVETDTGITQIDSLTIDEDDTVRRAAAFYANFDAHVDREAAVLKRAAADLVVGDVPPLAFAAAARAGVRSVAIGNFTWDWIYGIYPGFDRVAPDVIPAIRRAYATATCALRLPLHGGFEPMAAVTRDIPLIARQSGRDPSETRTALGLNRERPIVLASFGAYGADLPVDRLLKTDRFALIDPRRDPPPGFVYQDLVAAADVVVSKPGYGIVSECAANHSALLYTSRGQFREYDLFVAEMPRVLRCRYISQEDLLAGRWADGVDALLAQPAPPEHARVDGAAVAAATIDGLIG
jgi:L-arabinokinase